jgi:hypothetical protein
LLRNSPRQALTATLRALRKVSRKSSVGDSQACAAAAREADIRFKKSRSARCAASVRLQAVGEAYRV